MNFWTFLDRLREDLGFFIIVPLVFLAAGLATCNGCRIEIAGKSYSVGPATNDAGASEGERTR